MLGGRGERLTVYWPSKHHPRFVAWQPLAAQADLLNLWCKLQGSSRLLTLGFWKADALVCFRSVTPVHNLYLNNFPWSTEAVLKCDEVPEEPHATVLTQGPPTCSHSAFWNDLISSGRLAISDQAAHLKQRMSRCYKTSGWFQPSWGFSIWSVLLLGIWDVLLLEAKWRAQVLTHFKHHGIF